jgi:hypothetical protein
MSNDGLAVTPEGTTAAPKGLYEEMEQGDEVARGHVEVKEIIAYDFVEKRKVIERDKLGNEIGSKMVVIENGRKPYFCQTKEQELIFKENNPGVRTKDFNSGVRTESFSIQLLKSTAIKYLDEPRNVKEFTRPEKAPPTDDQVFQIQKEKAIATFNLASKGEVLGEPESTWRQQAKQLSIPLNKETGGSRKKEDVLTDIVARLTQTTVSTS